MKLSLSVIIPSKDRASILFETLGRVFEAVRGCDAEIIIINDSKTRDIEIRPEWQGRMKVFNNPSSGVASARNHGASQASNDWLIFMDDDMWVQQDTFERLNALQPGKDCCINANWVYPPEVMARYDRLPFLRYLHHYGFDSLEGWSSDVDWKKDAPFRVKGITSQFLVMHRSVFAQVGGYDTSFPFAGFEDHDLSQRLHTKNIPVYVDPANMLYHNEADRLDVRNWLERKWRGAVTRRVAVHLGYSELELQYSAPKFFFYKTVFACRRPLLWLLQHWWPSFKLLDRLYFLFVNIMLGTYSCMGYTGKEARKKVAALKEQP